jgi:cysteine desulfurase
MVDLAALETELKLSPALVAIQHVNNETGVIQAIAEISAVVRGAGSLLLADCAQSAGKLPLPDVEFIAISAHKLGGPPGVGALLVRDLSLLHATGGQERGYRRGTENLPGIAGMSAALTEAPLHSEMARLQKLRQTMEQAIEAAGGHIIAKDAPRAATVGAYAMPGVSSASQLVQFDLAGISVSAGSACSSGSMKPSRVLHAMGLPEELVSSTIRVSFGALTTDQEVERFVAEWRRIASNAKSRAA